MSPPVIRPAWKERVDEVIDKDELAQVALEARVRAVLLRYCRGVDRMNVDLVRSCYHEDAVDHHGSFHGDREEFLAWVWRLLAKYTMTMHYVTNIVVERHPELAHLARAESYGLAVHRADDGPIEKNLMVGFRYVDRFALRPVDGEPQWRISYRVATTEWVKRVEPQEWWPIGANMLTGARNPSDPVFADWAAPHPGMPA